MAGSRLFLVISLLLVHVQAQGSPELIILMTERHSDSADGVIYKLTAHHLNFTLLPLDNVITPAAIDYDNVNKRVYWTDVSKEQVRSADLDGENDVVVATLNSLSYPEGITLDSAAGKIIYTDRGNKVIVRIEMVGFASTTIVNSGLDTPWGIVADTKNKNLYWVDHQLNKVESSDYDGNARRTVASSTGEGPTGIAINENTGRLFWCDYNGGIGSILTDGTGRISIAEQTSPIRRFMDISLFNGFLYNVEETQRKITIVPEGGGGLMWLNSSYFENINGIHVFSPNSIETGCADGKYGVGCTGVCGRCDSNTPCEKTIGVCLGGCEPGYQGGMCVDVCTAGRYGDKCSSLCGQCLSGSTCHHLTGQCPSGCETGWKGEKCTERVCTAGKYGPNCSQDCGKCTGSVSCDGVTGFCPFGCALYWTGGTCHQYISGASSAKRGITDVWFILAVIIAINLGQTTIYHKN